MRVPLFFFVLVLSTAASSAEPPFGSLEDLESLEARVAALESSLSSETVQLPAVAIFTPEPISPGAPIEKKLFPIQQIQSIINRSTAPVLVQGFPNQARISGNEFDAAIGLFSSDTDGNDYVEALTIWIQTGGAQPVPEDFGGLSVFLL
jgi:hypothetical protein